jgi:transposase InsO family protein
VAAGRLGLPAPSYAALRAFLERERLPMIDQTLRHGEKYYNDHFRFAVERDLNKLEVNAVWVGDHRLCDTMISWPDGRIGRPWLTAFGDIRTGRLVGWVLRDRPTSDSVAAALRRAILGFTQLDLSGKELVFPPCGLPKVLYIDNGKEFTGGAMRGAKSRRGSSSKARHPLALPDDAAATVFSEFGVRVCNAIPYAAWSKPMESYFAAFSTMTENLVAGWTGRNPADKPECLRAFIERRAVLRLDEYCSLFAAWANWWNTVHVVGKRRSQPPMAFYRDFVPNVPDPARLDSLMMRAAEKKITADGITIAGLGRYHTNEKGFMTLTGLPVEVRYSVEEAEHIVVFDKRTGQRFLLDRQPEAGWSMIFGGEPDEAHRKAQRIRSAQRQAIREAGGEVKAAINEDTLPAFDPTGSFRAATQKVDSAKAARRQLAAPGKTKPRCNRPDAESRRRGSAVSRAWTDEDERVDAEQREIEEANRRYSQERGRQLMDELGLGVPKEREISKAAPKDAEPSILGWTPRDEAVAAERRKLHDEHEAWLTEGGREIFLRWGEGKPDELRKYWTDRGMPDVGEERAREAEARDAEARKQRAEVHGQ